VVIEFGIIWYNVSLKSLNSKTREIGAGLDGPSKTTLCHWVSELSLVYSNVACHVMSRRYSV
jgi:hypothetical protein